MPSVRVGQRREDGVERVERLLEDAGMLVGSNLYDIENTQVVHHLDQALKANRTQAVSRALQKVAEAQYQQALSARWPEIQKVINDHFANKTEDLVLVEELAKDLAPKIHEAATVEQGASLALFLAKIGIL